MEAEMEGDEDVKVFACVEIDLDYEFDAVKFFDLSREESPEETTLSERWFEVSRSYPPSPLVAKIIAWKNEQMERVNGIVAPSGDVNNKGWPLLDFMQQDESNEKHRSTLKNHCTKISNLMKPTASQLAKQNRLCQTKTACRIQKQYEVKTFRSFRDSSEFIHQAFKRRRLGQNHYSKILGLNQQIDLFHKGTDKKNMLSNFNNQHPRIKLTVPREPDLQTARRAVSMQPKESRKSYNNKLSEATIPISVFKALPLNRKILEAPTLPLRQRTMPQLPKFKEFNFKTQERALQHMSLSVSSRLAGSHTDSVQTNVKSSQMEQFHSSGLKVQNDTKPAEEAKKPGFRFKGPETFSRKYLSKGDVGVFRRAKQEPTEPKELNLPTTRRCQQAPLTELFNKLCLTTEPQ